MIGGQAVIEGVMMRSPHWTATAVRRADGEIVAFAERRDSPLVRHRWLRIPVIRGAAALYEALVAGVRALLWSANAAVGREEPLGRGQIGVTVLTGLGLAVGLFFLIPAAVIRWFDVWFATVYALNLAEGLLRVAILVGYVATIGRVADIHRVFAYHGAEHKAVSAYEDGAPLEPSAARPYSRFHPRCGTSFLLIVMVVAIVVFSFLGRPPLLLRLASRVALIPLVAGLSYEVIRGGARYRWFRPFVLPGIWLQRLTTREPDDAQLEVAVRALRAVVEREQQLGEQGTGNGER